MEFERAQSVRSRGATGRVGTRRGGMIPREASRAGNRGLEMVGLPLRGIRRRRPAIELERLDPFFLSNGVCTPTFKGAPISWDFPVQGPPFLQQDMTYIVPNQDNLPHQNGPLLPSRPAPLGLAVGPLHKHTRPLPEKSVRHSTHQHRSCTHPLDSRCAPVSPPAHVTCDFCFVLLVSCTSKSATSQ